MAKFNISTVQPGQVDDATKAIVETPVQQIKEKTPQSSAFEELLKGSPDVDTEAAAGEIVAEADKDPEIEAQREAERVTPLGQRIEEAKETSPKWILQENADTGAAKEGMNALIARAQNMKNLIDAGDISGGWGIGGTITAEGNKISKIAREHGPEAASEALKIAQANKPAAIMQKMGAGIIEPGTAKVNTHPKFAGTLSAVTENYFNKAQEATAGGTPLEIKDDFTGEPTGEFERPDEDYQITKSQGNTQLGHDINREFQRTKNLEEGRPTDQYEDLSPAEATVLGDMAKELFQRANPELIERTIGTDNKVYFKMTAQGTSVFKGSNEARKRLFPTTNTRPSKTVLPKGELVGEQRKLKRTQTRKAGNLGKINLINKAKENLHSVPNVVDPRRLRVLLATALPAVINANQLNTNTAWADIVGIGNKQRAKFEAAKVIADRKEVKAEEKAVKEGRVHYPGKQYNIEENIKLMSNTLAQNIRAVAMERGSANYLTYATQPFTGRVFPQQTFFDPTSSKLVRFATRNATPSVAKQGNRVFNNLQQMYAMMFIKDASEALPNERIRLLNIEGPKLYEWGKTIKAALDQQMTPEMADQVATAIANNIPPTDPNFPQVPELKLPEDIQSYLNKKGEDGLSVLEGLIDYAEFIDNMRAGKPHSSFFNAYMDGKTNGIANNGIQLGNEKIAKATGVLRDPSGKRLLDGDKDIRDQLGDIIHDSVKIDGFEGMDSLDNPVPVQNIITTIGKMRDLQKSITMTYGYGKELDSFRGDIEGAIEEAIASNPAINDISKDLPEGVNFNHIYDRALDQFDGDKTKLLKTIHKEYMKGLTQALSPEAAEARSVMRANATMYALMDEIFSIVGPSGFNLNMAGTQFLEATDEDGIMYNVTSKIDPKAPKTATAYVTKRKDTSAAERGGTPGLYAYGRSLTTPVQALDASTVAQTVTGRSWEKLKHASNGNPYIHTIYDAFKVDANGYDVVLEEVNKNWLNTSFDWSYLEQTRDSYKRDRDKFVQELNKLPGDKILKKGENPGVNMMDWLFLQGPSGSLNLVDRIMKTTYNPNLTEKQALDNAKHSVEFAIKVLTKMGYKAGSGQATVEQYKWFVNFMHSKVYDLANKNTTFTNRMNKNKAELRKKINPKTVYQYYSH